MKKRIALALLLIIYILSATLSVSAQMSKGEIIRQEHDLTSAFEGILGKDMFTITITNTKLNNEQVAYTYWFSINEKKLDDLISVIEKNSKENSLVETESLSGHVYFVITDTNGRLLYVADHYRDQIKSQHFENQNYEIADVPQTNDELIESYTTLITYINKQNYPITYVDRKGGFSGDDTYKLLVTAEGLMFTRENVSLNSRKKESILFDRKRGVINVWQPSDFRA